MTSISLPHDDLERRNQITELVEARFLQDLHNAGAHIPPRSTLTTALLRGLLWDKREEDLVVQGHTTIETQLVKNSRRSQLINLVASAWGVPRPDYSNLDQGLPHQAPTAQKEHTTYGKSFSPLLGSSTCHNSNEDPDASQKLSDGMAVDSMLPKASSFSVPSPIQNASSHFRSFSDEKQPRSLKEASQDSRFRSSPSLPVNLASSSSKEPLPSSNIAAPIVHSRYTRVSRGSTSSNGSAGSRSSTLSSPRGTNTISPSIYTHNSTPISSSPLSLSNSPILSNSAFNSFQSHSDQEPVPRKIEIPLDLKALLRDSDKEDSLTDFSPRSSLSARSPKAHRNSPRTSIITSSSWSNSTRLELPRLTDLGSSSNTSSPRSSPASPRNLPGSLANLALSTSPSLPLGDPKPQVLSPAHSFFQPDLLQTHTPVWVPRTNPLTPLLLYPAMNAHGEWFYNYKPISVPDMNLLLLSTSPTPLSPLSNPLSPFQHPKQSESPPAYQP